jgi:DNA polymerase
MWYAPTVIWIEPIEGVMVDYRDKRTVVIDIESYYNRKEGYDIKSMNLTTYIRDSRFWLLGLAYRFLDEEKTHWLAGNHIVEAWLHTVDWHNTTIINHNCKFDSSILAWKFGIKAYSYIDTVAIAKAVLGENVSGYSLKRLAEYMGLPPKGELALDGILHPSQEQLATLGEYCKNDVEITRAIYEKLIVQFPQSQLASLDWTIRAFIEPRLTLDIGVLERGVQKEKARREEIIKKSGVDKAVLSSNKQFAEYLISKGLAVPTKLSARTGKAIPAFARTDDGFSALAITASELHAARVASKSNLLETRGESLLAVAKTGSFPFDVGFSGAVQTHRYSGGSGAGGNPQNFTRNSFLRDAICAPEGNQLIVGDFAAIELRLLAWLAKEPKLMGKIINDEDVYSDFASLKYGRKITKADKAERQFGKCSVLGLGYNMGAKKFKATVETQTGMDITEDEAWKTVDLYRTTYFNVPKLWAQAHALLPLISTGKVGCIWFAPFLKVRKCAIVLPSGLEIKYPNLRQVGDEWVYDVYKKVYVAEPTKLYGGKMVENICQALAGELCKEAIERAEADGITCVGQVHDEILAIDRGGTSMHDVQMTAHFLKKHMEQAPKWMPTLRLKAEVGYGQNWNAAKV